MRWRFCSFACTGSRSRRCPSSSGS
jgi:hypothetical protein